MSWTTEADFEAEMMTLLAGQGFAAADGASASPELQDPLRPHFREAILVKVFDRALARLNPQLPEGALREVANQVLDSQFPGDLTLENQRLHELMVKGVPITWMAGAEERHDRACLIDWEDSENEWQVLNQFDVAGRNPRIPDVVVFLNGLPLVVIELKGTEGADLTAAFNQIETYKADIPALFRTNLLTVISDGITARYGSLSADVERFMIWRTIDGETVVKGVAGQGWEVLSKGLLNRKTLLDMLRWFCVFEDEGKGPMKKIAGYHQFHAVRKGVDAILDRRGTDGRGGVFWHTQGSGKSLLMAFLAGRAMHLPELANPTILVLTDRNDLDNQLFGTFSRCAALLGEVPVQAESTADLKDLLDREVGGVIFSTIQKFRPESGDEFPEMTDRDNVIVLVDEAHRTQYGFDAKLDRASGEIRHGLAHHLRRALPKAVFVAFTGTPIELIDANTRTAFGDYIDIYDISQAVEDGATVPIYYEARVAKIELDDGAMVELDEDFDEATEALTEEAAGAAGRRWTRVEALVGAEKRLDGVVADILTHFDARLVAMDGKAMIVGMSRRICAEIYRRIVAARPEWHSDDDATGAVKVIITGNATDPLTLQPHIRSKTSREALRNRFRDAADPLKLVVVRDMWLTGFDAPSMHTLYVDKPMRGHGLMQAIARVNRVFRDKPAGLVVDYIGLAVELKQALAHYSQGDRDEVGIDECEAVAALLDAMDVARAQFHGFDYSAALVGTPSDRLRILPKALDFIIAASVEQEGGEEDDLEAKRYRNAVAALVRAFKLSGGSTEAAELAAEVAFFVAVRAGLEKMGIGATAKAPGSDFAIEQLINRAVASTEVIDILEICGFDRPDISMLSDEFLLGLQNTDHKNLAVEALRRLLNGEIESRTRTNVVRKDSFSERLKEAIARYHNRSVDALQVIQELIEIAKDLRAEPDDNLNPEERAFYDALARNESAVQVMSNEELRIIATELVSTVRNNSGIDWWKRDNIRARMRMEVKKILRRHGYPPDLEADAIKTVIRQAEALAQHIS